MALNWPVTSPISSFEVTGARTSSLPSATCFMAADSTFIGRSIERVMK
jgi:hypothetical protein